MFHVMRERERLHLDHSRELKLSILTKAMVHVLLPHVVGKPYK